MNYQGGKSVKAILKKNEKRNPKINISHSPLSSAVPTGLEPATSGVTGRHSNQLNYSTSLSHDALGIAAFERRGIGFFAFALQSYVHFFYPPNILMKNFDFCAK